MSDPALITPAASLPVSVAEAKTHLRIDHSEDDVLIESMIEAATGHLDGPNGILGRGLITQVWSETFERFAPELPLRVGPVSSISGVTYTDDDGQPQAAPGARLVTHMGSAWAVPAVGEAWPSGRTVSVEYTVGSDTAPAPIKAAILLHVGALYEHRESIAVDVPKVVPMAYEALITPYRRRLV